MGQMCTLGDVEGGFRVANLGLAVLDRFGHVKTEWVARVRMPYYGFIAPRKEPIHSCLRKMVEASRVGIISGDHQSAMAGLFVSSIQAFVSGVHLVSLEKTVRGIVEQMKSYRQDIFIRHMISLHEIILVLLGRTGDPVVVKGFLNPTEWSTRITHSNEAMLPSFEFNFWVWTMTIAYHWGYMSHALEMAEKCRGFKAIQAGRSIVMLHYAVFFDAVICLTAARDLSRRKQKSQLISNARKALKELRKGAKYCPENYLHMCHLIEAELAVLKGNYDSAMSEYTLAITFAARNSFVSVEALACERAHVTQREMAADNMSLDYFNRAVQLYEEWGARAKVALMRSNMNSTQGKPVGR
jgi:hypothetical protein